MKSQLVGVIVVAPIFLAIGGVLNGIATNEAADAFHKGEAKSTLSADPTDTTAPFTALSGTNFGVDFNAVLETGGLVVSDKVTINLEIEAVLN